jgi:uncharacterized protein YuzE
MESIKFSYDEVVNMGYLYLRPESPRGSVARSIPWSDADVRAELVLDFDAEGHLIGIEIFSPKGLLLPEVLATAVQYPSRE